jgi:holliday junction DNA helicase RuvB
MSIELVTVSQHQPEEDALENTLRPQRLAQYIGQSTIKKNLEIMIQAAKQRGEALDHILLHGNPGLGKTTLAHIIAKEMGVGIRVTSGPAIERAGDVAAILSSLEAHDILFIDEIHRLHKVAEEILYPAMEDYALDLITGKGPAARTLRIDLPPFTIIGATTRMSLIAAPLRDRFGVQYKLEFYTVEEMQQIVLRSAEILGTPLNEDTAQIIAVRSRRTPRIANRLLKRVRDYAQVHNHGDITPEMATAALDLLHIDAEGLDDVDHRILHAIAEQYNGGPVGIQTLASVTAEEVETLEEVHEPYLLQMGLIARTPRGRVLTAKAYEYLGLTPPTHLVQTAQQETLDL